MSEGKHDRADISMMAVYAGPAQMQPGYKELTAGIMMMGVYAGPPGLNPACQVNTAQGQENAGTGAERDGGYRFCQECGTRLNVGDIFCRECGTKTGEK